MNQRGIQSRKNRGELAPLKFPLPKVSGLPR